MSRRPDLPGLEAFVAIAERGSFHRAAGHLGITQTALSHRMRKLEVGIGAILLHRTTRSVALTPAGATLLPRAKGLLEEAAGLFAELAAEGMRAQTTLAIGCLPTLAVHMLPAALARFAVRHPDVEVRVFDNSASEIAERVQTGEAAFGLTIVATKRWDLDVRPLLKETYVLVCPAAHPFARRRHVRWTDLEGERLIRIATQTGNRMLIDDALGAARERLQWRIEVQHIASAVAMVTAGVGLTVVPRSAIEAVRAENLVAVVLRDPTVVRTLGVVTRHGIPLSPLALDLLREIERVMIPRRSRS